MLRLDGQTWATLDAWSTHFERSAAEVIRQLLAQATPETFPASWHLCAWPSATGNTRGGCGSTSMTRRKRLSPFASSDDTFRALPRTCRPGAAPKYENWADYAQSLPFVLRRYCGLWGRGT